MKGETMKSDPVEAAIEAMERKPTVAAMRAADYVWKEEVSDVGLCPRMEKQKRIAAIIDRETGLPELLEACKRAALNLESMQRNKEYVVGALQSKGWPSTWIDGVIRGLEHSKMVLAKLEGKP